MDQPSFLSKKYYEFINRSSKYLPFLKKSKYIGSMFVVRALKKNKEKTDERTTSVYFHTKKIFSIFSGKWNNCIYLAKNLKSKGHKVYYAISGKDILEDILM